MRTLFIYNPHAGMMQIKNHLYAILNCFAEAEYDLTVYPTRRQGEAMAVARDKAADYDLIICSGGDGTLNETVNGILRSKAEKRPELGYIPAGSTNDYAASLKLPKNMEKAALLIISGTPHLYDVGMFNKNYFVYIAAFGAFTSISYGTSQDAKNLLGHLAYFLEGFKSLSDIRSYKMKITSKELKTEDGFIYGMITNTLTVGGLYKLDRHNVKLDDGLLEVILVREPKDPLQLNEITSFFLGGLKKTDMVLSFKTSRICIETEEEVAWTLDGEYGGDPKKVVIKVQEKALSIINK